MYKLQQVVEERVFNLKHLENDQSISGCCFCADVKSTLAHVPSRLYREQKQTRLMFWSLIGLHKTETNTVNLLCGRMQPPDEGAQF